MQSSLSAGPLSSLYHYSPCYFRLLDRLCFGNYRNDHLGFGITSFRTFMATVAFMRKDLIRTTTFYETLTQIQTQAFLCDTLFKRLEWQSAYVAIVSTVCVFVRAMWTHASARRRTTFTAGRRRNIIEQFGRDVLV